MVAAVAGGAAAGGASGIADILGVKAVGTAENTAQAYAKALKAGEDYSLQDI